MTHYHLAEINIAKLRAPITDPSMREFADNVDRINQLGDESPGFVWRFQTDTGDAIDMRVFDDETIIVNMTVWESIDALYQYSYYSQHTDFFRRRTEWFDKLESVQIAMWWTPEGHLPTLEEGKERLMLIQEHGPTPLAFTFKQRFTVEEMLEHIATP